MQNNYLFYDDNDEELTSQSSWLRVAQEHQRHGEEPRRFVFANANDTLSPPIMKKSRSLDLGRLRRQDQHQTEYTHEAVLGQYSGRW